jgi:Cu+-exporting ATPase
MTPAASLRRAMSATVVTSTLIESLPDAAAFCRHCGDVCAGSALFTDHGTFCCLGCESIFTLLSEHGLLAFYRCDVNPGVSQRAANRDASRFAALDDPDVARRLVEDLGGGRAAVTLHVPALHCASCLWLIEQLWRFDSGIARSEADLLRRTVRVEFRRDRTTLRAVAERLAAVGYEPVLDAERLPGRPSRARRELYLRIGVAGFAFGNVMLFSIPRYANGAPLEPQFQRLFDLLNVLFAIPVLLYSASPYFRAAWTAVRARAVTLEVPVALGLIVLFARSMVDITMGWGEGFLDSFSGLVFFLLIGRLFQQKAFDGLAFDRTVRSFFPLSVRVETEGEPRLTPLERVGVGDVMLVRPQEVVPADSILLDEAAAIDYAFVSGESAPARVVPGGAVYAGGRVTNRTARLVATKAVSHSRLAELWDHPVFAKPRVEWLTSITAAFGFWFVVLALGLAAAGAALWWSDARMAAQVVTAVLIIACPCALTLAAPITLGTGMGLLGRAGCYLKNTAVGLELSRIDTIVFDKTGTLTSDTADAVVARDAFSDEEWRLIRRLAAESAHPVSRAVAGRDAVPGDVSNVEETPGAGITGLVDGRRVAIGTRRFVVSETSTTTLEIDQRDPGATYASAGGSVAPIDLTHRERPGMDDALQALSRRCDVWLLSGDHDAQALRWRARFGERMRFRQSPEDKLAFVRALRASGRRVLMVGDGLNDAGALAAADAGIAVSDDAACLVPACDAVLRGDRLRQLPAFLNYARLARRVIVLCFAISAAYNVIGLTLALAGRLTPLATAILMPISSLSVVGVSVGAMRRGGRKVLLQRSEEERARAARGQP